MHTWIYFYCIIYIISRYTAALSALALYSRLCLILILLPMDMKTDT